MEILLIVFGISFLGMIFMIYRGVSYVRNQGILVKGKEHPVKKHLSLFLKKIVLILSFIAHSLAIMMSKLWARISYWISFVHKKIVKKIEDYFKHKNINNLDKDVKTQSILITTIKAYKKEIRKLNRKIEVSDKQLDNQNGVDISNLKNKIE